MCNIFYDCAYASSTIFAGAWGVRAVRHRDAPGARHEQTCCPARPPSGFCRPMNFGNAPDRNGFFSAPREHRARGGTRPRGRGVPPRPFAPKTSAIRQARPGRSMAISILEENGCIAVNNAIRCRFPGMGVRSWRRLRCGAVALTFQCGRGRSCPDGLP